MSDFIYVCLHSSHAEIGLRHLVYLKYGSLPSFDTTFFGRKALLGF